MTNLVLILIGAFVLFLILTRRAGPIWNIVINGPG